MNIRRHMPNDVFDCAMLVFVLFFFSLILLPVIENDWRAWVVAPMGVCFGLFCLMVYNDTVTEAYDLDLEESERERDQEREVMMK